MNASADSVQASIASRVESVLLGGRNPEPSMRDILDICDSNADAPWEVLALVDQYYRRGRISDSTFRVVNAQIQRFAIGGPAARAATRAALSAVPSAKAAEPPGSTGGSPAAVEPTTAAAALPAGTVLADRYVLEGLIDHGTSDTVYRAVDRFRAELPQDEQCVAVKFPAAGAETHRQFFRAQGLTHPHITRVLECGRSGQLDFHTLEFQRGKLLRDVLREMAEPMPEPQALAIMRDVGAAVAYAHEHGVVHGALDTKSVMISVDGGVSVLNFDSLPTHAGPTHAGPTHAGPTHVWPAHADPRHDLHALACMAYELLTGARPFPGRDAAAARQAGLRAKRGRGLRGGRWRAVKLGLEWPTAGKALTVKSWLQHMDLERAAPALPVLAKLLTQKTPRTRKLALTIAAIAAVALATVAALTVLDRGGFAAHLPHTVPPAAALVPAAAAVAPPVTRPQGFAPRPSMAASTGTGGNAVPVASQVQDGETAVSQRPGRLGFAADNITVPPDAPAARLVVRRTGGLHGEVGFSWWTEDGSARAGEDYISLGVKKMVIPDGQDSVTLFVPLVAPGAAPGPSVFFVELGRPTGGATVDGIGRVTVSMAPRS